MDVAAFNHGCFKLHGNEVHTIQHFFHLLPHMARPLQEPSDQPRRQDIAMPVDGMSAAQVSFPRQTEDFRNDSRVSYSKLENKWMLEEDNGTEWEYDESAQRWIPSVCLYCDCTVDE